MRPIALIAPNEQLAETARQLPGKIRDSVTVLVGNLDDGVRAAIEAEASGAEVIISRGGTATLIKRSCVKIPVVEIDITGYDILRCLAMARKDGSNVAVVGFHNVVLRLNDIENITGMHVRWVEVTSVEQFDEVMGRLENDRVRTVIGGARVVELASRYGMQGLLLMSGQDAIEKAVREAIRIVASRRVERVRNEQLRTILSSIRSGVVSVDEKGQITAINPVAEKLLGGTSSNIIVGRKLQELVPEIPVSKVLDTGKGEMGFLWESKNGRAVLDVTPIVVKGKPSGAIITFDMTDRIQQLEAKIRKDLHQRGHIAKCTFQDIKGNSEMIQAAKARAMKFAITDSTVLIEGESGVGKEMFAQSIHNASRRKNGPFVAVNCAALPPTLLESELFGYVDGAFTGAQKKGKPGLFELAHKGTIFLDEVSEMSPEVQARLLRVLQEREVMRIGDDRVIPIDIRVIAATNKSLKDLVKSGSFREDLYFRLDVLNLSVPPLRERREDIPDLVKEFISEISQQLDLNPIQLSREGMRVLVSYDWPGNVRELRNVIERLIVTATSAECGPEEVRAALGEGKIAGDSRHTWFARRVGVLSEVESA
ncbi:MAG TPA: sigma 54-interacting transcriptional regulator, partial [Firmicutes bacterium]|nr:sigma 54-interacting transcriptional regulator [Bacillota bacterium]